MNKTQMAIVGGIVLAIIVGCIAGGVIPTNLFKTSMS